MASAIPLAFLRYPGMQKKVFALNFDNNSGWLFKGDLRQKISIKATYELSSVPAFNNITSFFSNNIQENINFSKELIKENGPFNSRADFLLKNEIIIHLFFGSDPEKKEETRLYGYNLMQWDSTEHYLEINSCDSAPFDEEQFEQLGNDRFKGIGLYTIAQACYYYSKLAKKTNNNKDRAIYIKAQRSAFERKTWQRYGFKLTENQNIDDHSISHYVMYITAGDVKKLIAKYNIDINS